MEKNSGWELVAEILTASGQPVAGHTLNVEAMERAIAEGRALSIYTWSSMGESEASFSFATRMGFDGRGNIHPTFIVFPKPIPEALRITGQADWECAAEVFGAFGIETG